MTSLALRPAAFGDAAAFARRPLCLALACTKALQDTSQVSDMIAKELD
jgi:hypothetical protein